MDVKWSPSSASAAVVSVFGVSEDECGESVSSYDHEGSSKKRKEQDAHGAAEHIEEKLFAEVNRAAFGISFELFRVLALGELMNCSTKIGGD